MRVTGINFNTKGFKGVYIVKGNFEDTSKFTKELWKTPLPGARPYEKNACRQYNLSMYCSPKQNRYDVLVATRKDKAKLNELINELNDNPVKKLDVDTFEDFSDNPNRKEFYDFYMEKLKGETEKAEEIFGQKIKTLDVKKVLAAIKQGKFNFITGKIKS